MEFVAGEDAGGFEGLHVTVGDFDAARVGAGVEFRVHGQPGAGADGLEGFDDDLVGLQGASAPVAADRGEQPVLDLVPFAGARRQVADADRQSALLCQRGGLPCSRAGAGPTTSSRSPGPSCAKLRTSSTTYRARCTSRWPMAASSTPIAATSPPCRTATTPGSSVRNRPWSSTGGAPATTQRNRPGTAHAWPVEQAESW